MLSQSEPTEAATTTTANNNNNNINLSSTNKVNLLGQQLLNNGTPEHEPRQRRQQQQRPSLPASPDQQATGNETARPAVDNKIWLYFERSSQGDTNQLKCLLCSTELCNNLKDDLHLNSSTHSLLWNHLKVKHAIDREINDSSSERRRRRQAFNSTKQHNSRNTKQAPPANDNHSQKINDTRTRTTSTTNTASTTGTATSTTTTTTTINMTNTKHHQGLRLVSSSANAKKSPSSNHDINDLRRNLDLFEYDDLSKASLKPLPTSSLSRNLFERLNQLSSPVTRKLKFWNKKSFQVNQYDPCFKVIYLGNLGVQFWSKDESCLEKPLNTLWNNYLVNMKTEIVMRLTICNSGLKAITRQHGLTQYWSNRLVYCCSHKNYPKIFSWIYRHEGKKMRQELRCHAVFCSSPERASKMVTLLNQRLTCALEEFKREKKSRGQTPSIMAKCHSLSASSSSSSSAAAAAAAVLQTTLPRTVPLRRQILAKGSANFRPPLERSKSAPKLTSIREEDHEIEEEEEEEGDIIEEEEEDCSDTSRQFNGDNNIANEDDISQDELEYEQSFDDRDDDDDDSDSDYNDDELGKHDDEDSSTHKVESNEETSNSSVYATGDISYDNIIANRHHLSANQERLDNESTLTAPIILKLTSSLRRSSLRSSSLNQHESLNSDPTESMSDGGQHDLDSQLASTASSTLNSSCHINNSSNNNNNTSTPEHENGQVAVSDHNHHNNTVAHYFGQIKL